MTWFDTMERRAGYGHVLLAGTLCCACGGGAADEGYMDDQPPNGVCETDGDDPDCVTTSAGSSGGTTSGDTATTSTGSTGGVDADQCKASSDCPDGQLCVADFLQDKRGPFQCVDQCVADMDDAKWCADAAACCDGSGACTDRGFCMAASGTGDTGTSG